MGNLYFKEADVIACLEKALEIRDTYHMYVLVDHDRKSVDDLLWVCQEYLGKKIEVGQLELPAEGSSIKASFWALEDGSYIIGLLAGMTEEELRFVLCKEIFHVIFDEESRRSLELGVHLEDYTSNIGVEHGRPNCSAAWETLAEIAATEFLLPLERRLEIAGRATPDFAKSAAHYGLPRYHVEVACGEANLDYIKRHLEKVRRAESA